MEDYTVSLTEHEIAVILNALDIASTNSDEYEKSEYEEVNLELQRKLDESYDDELE